MLEVTRDEMDVLVRLQENEDNKAKVKAALSRIPDQMAELDKQLVEEEQKMRDRETLWESQKKKYRDCESEIKLRQENIQKSDMKLMSIKSNKEYQAVLTEIEDLKRQIAKLEDSMLTLLFDLETAEKHLADDRKAWEEEKSRLAEEKQDLEDERRREEERLVALDNDWKEIAEKASKALLDQFLAVRGNVAGGKAVAEVRDYVCQGCFMNIPAQMYNELHTTNILRFCPFCNRIVFVNGTKAE